MSWQTFIRSLPNANSKSLHVLRSLGSPKQCRYFASQSYDRPINDSKNLSVLATTTKKNQYSYNNNEQHLIPNDNVPLDNTPIHMIQNECKSVDDILNVLWRSNCVLDDTVYMHAIQKCNDLGDFQGALRIFHMMYKNDMTQTIDIYNALIQCLCDCDRTQLAYKYLNDITTAPNKETFIILLSSCKQRPSSVDIAENVWKKMIFEYHLTPTVDACNAMIHIYARCGDVHKAETVWNHLININKVDAETCAEILNCYAIKKDEKKLIEVQTWMRSNAIPMNESHYLGIVKYYLGVSKLQKVLGTFGEMASSHNITMDEALLYQLCLTYLRLQEPEVISRTLMKQYPKLFNQSHDLQGLLFEAHVMRYTDDDDIIPIFRHFIAGNKLTGYWKKHTKTGTDTWWIDLHGVYRRKRMIKFILRYIFHYEREYITEQLRMKQDIVILCGYGVHSDAHYHGTAKTITEQELLSWTPAIKSKIYKESQACLVLNSQDILQFFHKNPLSVSVIQNKEPEE